MSITKESLLVTHKIVISTFKNILSSQHTFKDYVNVVVDG